MASSRVHLTCAPALGAAAWLEATACVHLPQRVARCLGSDVYIVLHPVPYLARILRRVLRRQASAAEEDRSLFTFEYHRHRRMFKCCYSTAQSYAITRTQTPAWMSA